MNKWLLVLLLALASNAVKAQDCALCGLMPRVSNFDLDVRVPKPADTGKAFIEWRQLFWYAKFAQSKLFELNRNCVHFIQPLAVNADGTKKLVVSQTKPLLPEGNISSQYTDYLVTGYIAPSGGDQYLLHLELQSVCGRKRVASADVPFQPTPDPDRTMEVANRAASMLSPLADKIHEFAKNERATNTEVAYSNRDAASISIVPKKRTLAAGEETELQISVKDCDGLALANREIVFTKGAIGGFPINGTTGGTVTPASVRTDNNGKAKAKFKMGNGKNALVCGHLLFKKPSGCPGAMTGSVPINGVPVKVEIVYSYDESIEFNPQVTLGAAKITGADSYSSITRFYRSVFYHYPSRPKEYVFLVDPQSGEKSRTVYESAEGYFVYMGKQAEASVDIDFAGVHAEEKLDSAKFELNSGTVKPTHDEQIYFAKATELEPMSFALEFHFFNEELEHPVGTGGFSGMVTLQDGEKGVKITTNKINDPQSPYKTEYIIDCHRIPGDMEELNKLLGKNLSNNTEEYKHLGKEYLRVRILSPY